jgi:hypothetical protein
MAGDDGSGGNACFFGGQITTPVEIEYRMLYRLSELILQILRTSVENLQHPWRMSLHRI